MVELAPPHTPSSREQIMEDVREFIRIYSLTHPGTSSARIKYLELSELGDLAGRSGSKP